jgi:hypothetical protein
MGGRISYVYKEKKIIDVEDRDELKYFKNIRIFGIFRVVACVFMFPSADTINSKLKHVDLGNMYLSNVVGKPIASFEPVDLDKNYHMEKETKKVGSEFLRRFKHISIDLCPT